MSGVYWALLAARRPLGRARDHAPTPLDRRMMARALDLARRAGDAGEVPVGAVVYRLDDGRVLGEGANTREASRDPAGHAEFIAIARACAREKDWRLNHCALAVALEPCAMCAGLIVNARVGRVIFGAADPKAGMVRSLARLCDDPRLNHRAEIVPGVMEADAAALLAAFFHRLRARRPPGQHPASNRAR